MSFIELEDAFVWTCESPNCKQVIFPPSDFFGRVAELRARGWSFHLNDDEGERDWAHYCAYCTHKRRQTSIMDQRIRTVKG
jgi:hypothetical protein